MKDLLEYVVKSLVNNPDKVRIEEEENGDEVVFSVYVDASDMGRIIGKGGKIHSMAINILKEKMIDLCFSQGMQCPIKAIGIKP